MNRIPIDVTIVLTCPLVGLTSSFGSVTLSEVSLALCHRRPVDQLFRQLCCQQEKRPVTAEVSRADHPSDGETSGGDAVSV